MKQKQIIEMLDRLIDYWRSESRKGQPAAGYYIDAYQTVRKNICGKTKP